MSGVYDFLASVGGDREKLLAAGPEILAGVKALENGPRQEFAAACKAMGIEHWDVVLLLAKACEVSPTQQLIRQLEHAQKVKDRKRLFTQAMDHEAFFKDLRRVHDEGTNWPQLMARLVDLGIPKKRLSFGRADPQLKFGLTDVGNGERFVAQHRGKALWCDLRKSWFLWDGSRWKRDEILQVMELAKRTARSILDEAKAEQDPDRRKEIAIWGFKSEEWKRVNSMVSAARSSLAVHTDDLDANPWLLNCRNGTVDLTTGGMRPHDPGDLITKMAPVDYLPDAKCPRFERFLSEIFLGREELVVFAQRLVGYRLTGIARERVFVVAWGKGRNGKSTFVDLVCEMLGDYALKLRAKTLMAKRGSSEEYEVADLPGIRFAYASESTQGARLDTALVKELTGKETMSARQPYERCFRFKPQFEPWLVTNHKPRVSAYDEAIWDRLMLIPFEARFEGEAEDRNLIERLKEELPGVLAWAVRGCLAWQAEKKLQVPQHAVDATKAYREEEDVVAEFVREMCVVGVKCRVQSSALYQVYRSWCEREAQQPMGSRSFRETLIDRGFQAPVRGHANYEWSGIGLISLGDGHAGQGVG